MNPPFTTAELLDVFAHYNQGVWPAQVLFVPHLHSRRGRAPRARGRRGPGDHAGSFGGGAELVVVGTHGRADAEPRRVGHVAMAAVRGASCNVLVIPAATRRAAAPQASPLCVTRSAPGAVLAVT